MFPIKKTRHLINTSLWATFIALPLGFGAIFAGIYYSYKTHDLRFLLLDAAGIGVLQVMTFITRRAGKYFKCPQCKSVLTRSSPTPDLANAKFTCARCCIVWDASLPTATRG